MPMPYSHYVLAQKIAEHAELQVHDPAEYYVGAFMPDIRYFTQEPRERYHFPVEGLARYRGLPDVTPDFLLGYGVHLLIDEVWEEPEVKDRYRRAFPWFLRRRMTRGLQALAFELYCLRRPVEFHSLRPTENGLTRDLDVETQHVVRSVESMERYLRLHSLEAAYAMAVEAQIFPEHRLATVQRILRLMRTPGMRVLVNWVVARASRPTFDQVVELVVRRSRTELFGLGEVTPAAG